MCLKAFARTADNRAFSHSFLHQIYNKYAKKGKFLFVFGIKMPMFRQLLTNKKMKKYIFLLILMPFPCLWGQESPCIERPAEVYSYGHVFESGVKDSLSLTQIFAVQRPAINTYIDCWDSTTPDNLFRITKKVFKVRRYGAEVWLVWDPLEYNPYQSQVDIKYQGTRICELFFNMRTYNPPDRRYALKSEILTQAKADELYVLKNDLSTLRQTLNSFANILNTLVATRAPAGFTYTANTNGTVTVQYRHPYSWAVFYPRFTPVQILASGKALSGTSILDLSALGAGTYWIVCYTADGQFRFVLNKQ